MNILYKLRFVPLLLSIVVFNVGLYYSMIKAGIPYQDPTPAMTEKYMSDMRLGNALMFIGFILFVVSVTLLIVLKIIKRKNSINTIV